MRGWKASLARLIIGGELPPLDTRPAGAMFRKGDVVECIANPRKGVKRMLQYVSEPAEIVVAINEDACLVKMFDGFLITVDNKCIKRL